MNQNKSLNKSVHINIILSLPGSLFPTDSQPPGRSSPYQDVRVLRLLPSGWAGAVAEFEYPVLLGRDKEVPWQQAANAQAEEDDVGPIVAVLGPLQAGWWAVQQLHRVGHSLCKSPPQAPSPLPAQAPAPVSALCPPGAPLTRNLSHGPRAPCPHLSPSAFASAAPPVSRAFSLPPSPSSINK